jgi:uncharacterized cupin superfamily protein
MPKRPDFIKHYDELTTQGTFSYPGDTETFGTGASLSRKLGLKRVAVNYEILQPGDRSSWPHAHSEEEEFIFILQGEPQMWIDGFTYNLKPGDCVGLPAGTGHAHTLINNSNQVVTAIVVGEMNRPNDKIFYPKHPQRNEEMKQKGHYWNDHPEHVLGSHDGCSDKKR